MKQTFWVCLLVVSIFAHKAAAQTCVDQIGRPVTVTYGSIKDTAMATIGPGGVPLIYINANVWAELSLTLKTFVLAHECGHHVLGTGNEIAADCYAAHAITIAGMPLGEVQAFLYAKPGDATHLPGPSRAAVLESCIRGGIGTGATPQQQFMYFDVTGQILAADYQGNLFPANQSGQIIGPTNGHWYAQNGQYVAIDYSGRSFVAMRIR